MEARDFAETLKEWIAAGPSYHDGDALALLDDVDTHWGYGDADFFVETEDEGTFLVTVVKVSD